MTVYNRKMFRKGGVSKQPTGILASSSELMTSAQKAMLSGNPLKARTGASVNYMPQLNLVPGKNRQTPFGGYETVPASRVNLSPMGADYQSGRIDIFGKDRTRFGKTALEQLAQTESAFGRQVGPFDKKIPIDQLQVEGGDISKQNLGVVTSDDTNAINTSIGNILEKYKTNLAEQREDELAFIGKDDEGTIFGEEVESKDKDKNQNKTVYEQSSDVEVRNEASTVNLSDSSVNKGAGKEQKGEGKANVAPNSDMGKKYQNLTKTMIQQMQQGKVDNATDNSLITHGYDKKDVEEMTEEEKIVEMKAMLNKFGQNTEETEDLGGLNLMMLGLSIAAGDSPDALTNIAKGAKEFVGQRAKEIKQKIKDRKAKEEAMDLLAIKTVLGRTDKKEDREFQSKEADKSRAHDMKKISTMNANDLNKLGITLDFKKMIADNANNLQVFLKDKDIASRYDLKKLDVEMFNASAKNSFKQLTMKLKSSEMIARNAQLGQDERAKAALEAQNLRAVISNFDKGYGFAFYQGAKDGLEGEDLAKYVEENGKRFASNSLLTGPDSIRRMIIKNAGTVMKEQNVDFNEAAEIIMKTITESPELSVFFKKDLQAFGINVDTTNQNKNTDTSGITVKKIN